MESLVLDGDVIQIPAGVVDARGGHEMKLDGDRLADSDDLSFPAKILHKGYLDRIDKGLILKISTAL